MLKNHRSKPHIIGRLYKLFRTERAEIERTLTPYFYTYYKDLFLNPENLKSYIGFAKYIVYLTNARGKVVLDAGCGFGLLSLLFCSEGARVIAIDLDLEKVSVAAHICKLLNVKLENLEFIRGDLLNLPLREEEFDVIICNEVVSHVRDKETFFDEAKRVLRRGGKFYIRDGNNSLDFIGRVKRRIFWKKVELGPVDIERLRQNDTPLPWLVIRARMIKAYYPHLNREIVIKLAKKTAGLYGDEIRKSVEEYLKTGKIRKHCCFKYRNPLTGEYPEREFNPFEIVKQLNERGFHTKLLKPNPEIKPRINLREITSNFIKASVRVLYPLSIIVYPSFEILAEKL